MEILEYLIRVRGGRQGRQEAQEAAIGLEALQHAEKEAGQEAAKAAPKLLFFAGALKALESSSGGAGGVRSNIFGLQGRIGTLIQIAALASPVIMGLSGSLIALTGSLAAAAGGAGAIGVGGVGALAVGLGGLIAIAKPVIGGLKDIKTAQDAYNLSVKQYGYWSKEAGTAAQHLHAVVAVSGGQPVLRIAQAWHEVTKEFRANTTAARRSLIGAIGSGVGAAGRLMPAFAGATNTGVGAVSKALRGAFAEIGSPQVSGMITNLGQVFANISGSGIRALTDLFIVFGRVAVVAGPYVERMALGFERWAHGLRAGTADGGRLGRIIGTLVGHLRSWWDLTKAVGRVFFVLLGGGAKEGKGLVDSLTGVVTKFGDWLEKMRDTGKLQKFFKDAAANTRELFGAAKDLLVPMLSLVRTALPPLTRVIRWLRPVLPELIGLFIGWRVAAWGLGRAFAAAAAVERWRELRATIRRIPWGTTGRSAGRTFGRAFAAGAVLFMVGPLSNAFAKYVDKHNIAGGASGRTKRAQWIEEHDPTGITKAARHLAGSLGLPVPKMSRKGHARARGAADLGPPPSDLAQVFDTTAPGWRHGDIVVKASGREVARVTRREIASQMARGG